MTEQEHTPDERQLFEQRLELARERLRDARQSNGRALLSGSIRGVSAAVNNSFDAHFQVLKLEAILELSDELGIPLSIMEKQTHTNHFLMDGLIDAGKPEMARELALEQEAFRLKHPGLIEQTQSLLGKFIRFNTTDKELQDWNDMLKTL